MTHILFRTVRWLRWIGIISTTEIYRKPNAREQVTANLRISWHIFAAILTLSPTVAYMLYGTADFLEMLLVFHPVITVLGITLQLLLLVMRRKTIHRLLDNMEKFLNTNSGSFTRAYVFNTTEAKVTLLLKVIERLMFVDYVMYMTVPPILEFQASRMGTTTSVHHNAGLFKDLYFFNVSTSPMRELCYITMAFGLFSAVIFFIAIGNLFYGLCLYIAAMYKELQNMLESIDSTETDQTHRSLCDCIEYHLAIINFTETFNDIYGHIIFVQYAYWMLGTCTNFFTLFFTSNLDMIKIVIMIICQMVGLFMYGWFGQLVLDEADRLRNCIYGIRWYDFDLNDQKMIQLMILRTQRPCGLAAYNYFACDLPTFFNIISKVYSMVSFLNGVI